MKKLIILCLLTLIMNWSYSQTEFKSYMNTIGTWNTYTKKWDFGKINKSEITFTYENDFLTADDASHSRYYIYGKGVKESNETYSSLDYKSVLDERNRKCYLLFYTNKKENYRTISIMYDDTIFKYFLEDDNLSKFNN